MSTFIGKVKGRGYFNGFKTSTRSISRSDYEIQEYMKTHNVTKWYAMWKHITTAKCVFKRNLSDVSNEFIFDSEEDFDMYKNGVEFPEHCIDVDAFNKMKVEEYDESKREKRVVPSTKRLYYTSAITKLEFSSKKTNPNCGVCGTNIYDDEARMNTQFAPICIHCLEVLGKQIINEYDKTPEKYKDDWLLARSVDI